MSNYRGVKKAHIVRVLEGKGTEENPYVIVEYVLAVRKDGTLESYGKIVSLTQEEKNLIGPIETNE